MYIISVFRLTEAPIFHLSTISAAMNPAKMDERSAKKTKVEKPAAKKPQPKASASKETFDDLLDWPSMPSFDTMSLATSLFQPQT